jgi:hypothetical protein
VTRAKPSGTSERLFAEYLDDRELAWRYGEPVGGRTPGFSVFSGARSFVAAVHDPTLHRPARPGFANSYAALGDELGEPGPTRRAIASVRRAGLPYAAVIGRSGSDRDIEPRQLALSMFGGSTAAWGSAERDVPAPAGGGGDRREPPGRRLRGVSAVAVMQFFNPTLWRVERAWAQRIDRSPPGTALRRAALDPDGVERLLVMGDLAQRLLESGAFVPDARSVRMVVVHNPFAAHPLDVASFGGPHDEQWRLVVADGVPAYRRSWSGPRLHEVGGAVGDRQVVAEHRRPA